MGNYKDTMMEQLADKGDGNYSYVDSEAEARKLFSDEVTGCSRSSRRT
jgi:Ca-activated chloride channel family protein